MNFSRRRPREACRISIDEEDLHLLYVDNSEIYNTIEFMNAWENYNEYRNYNETKACVLSNIEQKIIHVNEEWENICGYSQFEIQGKGFELFQGPDTDKKICDDFVNELQDTGYAKMININYDRYKSPIKLLIEGFKLKFKNINYMSEDYNMPHFWSTIQVI